jgi:hypothetical protein
MPALLVALALFAAACGGDGGVATTSTVASTTSTNVVETTTTSAAPSTPPSTAAPSTTTTVQASTTTAPSAPTTTTGLAGEPIDFGPAEGDVLMVIGVRYDDVLNLRAGPGTTQTIRAEIPPTFDDLVAEGNTRQLPASFWIEVDYNGTSGWVSLRYVGYEGDTTDETSTVVAQLGETPVASTMEALAQKVASVFASDEPKSDIVQVTPVSTGDLSEVTYDVIGLGDDAVGGVRLHIFAQRDNGGFGLKSVEVTVLCSRGVDDGACV